MTSHGLIYFYLLSDTRYCTAHAPTVRVCVLQRQRPGDVCAHANVARVCSTAVSLKFDRHQQNPQWLVMGVVYMLLKQLFLKKE